MKNGVCLAIVGPTASGKTKLAVEIAERISGEIVCMDSTTVYKGFDIGSSKPTAEERARVPHHLLDLLEPDEPFSAGHFVNLANDVISKIEERGKVPIVVGGTYFYLRALQHGLYPTPVIPGDVVDQIEKDYFEDEALNTARMHRDLAALDPKSAETIHPNDRYRLIRALAILRTTQELPSALKPAPQTTTPRLWMKYAVLHSRHTLNANIVRRTESMLGGGIIEETRQLMERHPQARPLQSIGYHECALFLKKQLTEKQLRNEIIEKTRQLAKRQVTWLRSDPEIRYIDHRDTERVVLEVSNLRFAAGFA